MTPCRWCAENWNRYWDYVSRQWYHKSPTTFDRKCLNPPPDPPREKAA